MKNFRKGFLFSLLIASIATTSCKKVWYCDCKSGGQTVTSTAIDNVGKVGAKSVCWEYEYQAHVNGANYECNIR